MPSRKPYQLVVLSSDSDAEDFRDDFAGQTLSPSKTLPLRQRDANKRKRGFHSASRKLVNGNRPQEGVSFDDAGNHGDQDIPMDHNAGEADDEDEDVPVSKIAVEGPKTLSVQSGIANFFQPRPVGTENRPKGRFWLDTVQSKWPCYGDPYETVPYL